MAMTREEFFTVMMGLKTIYTDPKFFPDDAIDTWYRFLEAIPYEVFDLAAKKHVLTSVFPPTISDLWKNSVPSAQEEEMEGLEAWSIVKRAIRNSGYHAEEEFEKLPDTIQKAIGSPSNLREMAMMEEKNVNTIEQSHFISSYRGVKAQKKNDAMLPAGFKAALERAKNKGIASNNSRMIEDTHGELR